MKLKNGEFSSTQTGNITIKNKAGISGTTYISFFPSEAQLHFTLVTTTGEVYEAATSTTIKLEKGKVYEAPALTCTLLPSAKVGDYYYSDATFSSEKNENKTCIGIVYALDDADGNLSPTLSTSPFGRIVALGDNQSSTKWISKAEDIEGIENYTTADGTLTSGVLPYYTEPPILSSPIRTRNVSRGQPFMLKPDNLPPGCQKEPSATSMERLTPPTSVKVLPATRQEATATNTVPAANRQVNGIYRRQAS